MGEEERKNIFEEAKASKSLRICSVLGGLDLARLQSFKIRSMFSTVIEDVELLREHMSEAMYNGGLLGGLSNLNATSKTLDWKARNLTRNETTLTAGLGWCDDRKDRRVDRQVTFGREPYVGNKQADHDAMDTSSNLLPWIVDRRSKSSFWFKDHQNGDNEASTGGLPFDQLYAAAWVGSWGQSNVYYPPMSSFGHPYTLSDVVGPHFDLFDYEAIRVALPENNPGRQVVIGDPYADLAHPGRSMISPVAPFYYTGNWRGNEYNDTFMGVVGVDITLDSVASLFDDLEDTLTDGSFAFLADVRTFSVISISQSVVEKIYPERTGFENERIANRTSDNSVVQDRRNQTYLVGDTIWQTLLDDLPSANWTSLHEQVNSTARGERGHTKFDVTLTGTSSPQQFYVMYDRWKIVSDWVLLVFAPVAAVDASMNPKFSTSSVLIETFVSKEENNITNNALIKNNEMVLSNEGTLDFIAVRKTKDGPEWLTFVDSQVEKGLLLKPGERFPLEFVVKTNDLSPGRFSAPVVFNVQDNGYHDCFHTEDISFQVAIEIKKDPELNQMGAVRIASLILSAIIIVSSLSSLFWVFWNRASHVVRASQPIFLIPICLGSLLMGLTVIPFSMGNEVATTNQSNIACMSVPWTFTLGFSITFAALFGKIQRVNKMLTHAGTEGYDNAAITIIVTKSDIFFPLSVLSLANSLFLLMWTLFDPLVWELLTDEGDWNSYGTCCAHGKAHIPFLVAIGIMNTACFFYACFQSYQSQSISDEYEEVRYIFLVFGGWFQLALAGMPLLFVVNDVTASFFVKSGLIFTTSMTVLLLIFIPKFIFFLRERQIFQEEERIIKAADNKKLNANPATDLSTETFDESEAKKSGVTSMSTNRGLRMVITDETADEHLPKLIVIATAENRLLKVEVAKLDEKLRQLEQVLSENGIELVENDTSHDDYLRRVFFPQRVEDVDIQRFDSNIDSEGGAGIWTSSVDDDDYSDECKEIDHYEEGGAESEKIWGVFDFSRSEEVKNCEE